MIRPNQSHSNVRTLTLRLACCAALTSSAMAVPRSLAPQDGTQGARRVQVARVASADLSDTMRLVGSLKALATVTLMPRVDAIVQSVHGDIGDEFQAGEVVARLAAPDMTADLAVLEAEVVEAEAYVADRKAQIPKANAMLIVAQADARAGDSALAAREAEYAVADRTHTRLRGLLAKGGVTQAELDESEARWLGARGAAEQAKAAVAVHAARVEAQRAEIVAAEAGVSGADARLRSKIMTVEAQRVRLAFLNVSCPFPKGRIAMRHVDPGALVMENESPILTLVDTSRVRLQLSVPEAASTFVRVDMPVDVRFDAFPGVSQQLTVTRSSGVIDAGSRTLLAEIEIYNPDGRYLPGMFAHVSLTLSSKKGAMVIPGNSVYQAEDGSAYVMAATQGRVERRTVVLGLDDGRRVEVQSGLQSDDLVVVGRPAGLADKDAIDYKAAAAPGGGQ